MRMPFSPCFISPYEHQTIVLFLSGKIPIMLRSTYCMLNGMTDRDLTELNSVPSTPADISSSTFQRRWVPYPSAGGVDPHHFHVNSDPNFHIDAVQGHAFQCT
jgi:hypothetical protein